MLGAYQYTGGFPKYEMFALASQLRRAAVSIPANIVEGFRRQGRADKARFMNLAEASLEECRYFLILAEDLGYGTNAHLSLQLEDVSRMLGAYAAALRKAAPPDS